VELVFLFGALAAGVLLLVAVSWRERPTGAFQTVELRFGTDTKAETVTALLGCIAGLPGNAVVVFDTVADAKGIRHFLHTQPSTLDLLRSQWRGVLPSLRMGAAADMPKFVWRLGGLLRLSGRYAVLRSDAVEQSAAAVLGSLQPLSGDGEGVLLRWVLGAGRRRTLPEARSQQDRSAAVAEALAHLFLGETSLSGDHLRLLRAKFAGPALSGVGVVAVSTAHPKRSWHLLSRVVSPLRTREGAYGRLSVRRLRQRRLERLIERVAVRRPDLYAPEELVAVSGLPTGVPAIAGLKVGSAPVLLPSARIPSAGRVLAISTWPGIERTLAQPLAGSFSHTLIGGPSGVGKSSLIAGLALQEAAAGHGFLLLDGKGGELADDLLARLPEQRHGEVIVLDPSAPGPLPGLQLFGEGSDPEITAELVLGVFAGLFRESWGPMSSRWLRAGLLAVAHDPRGTLADLPFVFTSHAYRRRLMNRIDDPLLANTLGAYESMRPAERAHQLSAPLNKVEELVGRRAVRAVLAQAKPAIDMHAVLATGKIVIVSVSPARIGPAARLIAALVIYKTFEAVLARGSRRGDRRPFSVFIDEPKLGLADIPVPLDSLFETARSACVGVVLGVQSLGQLRADLRAAVQTNAATIVAFRQSADDAKILGREFVGAPEEALQHLGQYEVLMRIGLGPGEVSSPVTGRTLALPAPTAEPAVIRSASAARYGVDPAEVDAALAARHRQQDSEELPPVGFARRQP
jgi:hypothetical protein